MVSLVQNSLIFSLSALSYGKNICRPTNHIIAAVARLSIIKFKIFLLHIFRSWRSIVMLGGLPLYNSSQDSLSFPGPLAGCLFCDACIGLLAGSGLVCCATFIEIYCSSLGGAVHSAWSRNFFDSHILQIPFSGQPLRVFNKLHGSEALLLLVEPRLKIHSIVGEMRTWLGILISFRGAFKGYSHFSDDWVIFSNSIFTLSMFAYNLCFIEHVRSMAVAVGGDLWAFLDSLGWARCCIGLTFKHTKLWYIGNRPLH